MPSNASSPAYSISSLEDDREPQTEATLERHEQYYIHSGDVVFRVDNKLFRIHRYFLLRESPLFRDMLSLPAPSGMEREGTSDKYPISLPQVTSQEFAHFLWIFYNPKYSIYEASVETWTAILRLAHLWQCDEIRDLAFRELDKLSVPPVQRVVLTTRYDARPKWREVALADLGARPEPLSIEDGRQLGLDLSIRVAELRERIRGRNQRIGFTHGFGWGYGGPADRPSPVIVVPSPGSRSRSQSRSPSPTGHAAPRTPSPGPGPVLAQPQPVHIYSPQDLEDTFYDDDDLLTIESAKIDRIASELAVLAVLLPYFLTRLF